MSRHALPCIVCSKPLKNVDEDADSQPCGGTTFETAGHYGSTIHDEAVRVNSPGEATMLVVSICDTCIMRAIDAGVIQSYSQSPTQPFVLSRHPLTPEQRAWVLAQNEKEYGSAWGLDEPVDYDEQMRLAGRPEREETP